MNKHQEQLLNLCGYYVDESRLIVKEDNKKYNEQRAVMIQEQNKGMVRMTVVCTILASIGIGIYGICIGLYYMLKRNKKIDIYKEVGRTALQDSHEQSSLQGIPRT